MESNHSRELVRWVAIATAIVLVNLPALAGDALAAINNPPNPPVVQTPLDGATNTNLQVILRWQGGSDPDGDSVQHDLYFGTTSPPPLLESDVWYPSVRTVPLQVATTYRWRVIVRDEHGAETVGPEWTFTTKSTNTPPEAPHYPNPAHNFANAWLHGSLRWTSDDPDGFDLSFDVYFGTQSPPPFVGTVGDYSDSGGEYNYAGLALTTMYHWQIVARDPQGATTPGPIWTFTTKANSAPYAPSNPQPPTGGIGSASPVLTWKGSDVDVQPLTYDVYLGTTSPPPLVATALPDPSFSPPLLQPGVTYYWSVSAFDGFLHTNGPVWSFGARQPGDVVVDNQLTVADAACALEIYLWNPACGGLNGYLLADSDCSANVTPGDARCLHREAVGLGCAICDEAIATSPEEEKAVLPSVSVSNWFVDGNALVVRLAVEDAAAFNAFGFYAVASPSIPLLQAQRRGASTDFDVLEARQVSPVYAYIGAYSLADQTVGIDAEFIELRFDVSGGVPNYLHFDGFVDDLAGASAVMLPLGSTVDVGNVPSRAALHPNYPNPFNPQTTISYDVPASATPERVQLRIVDVTGRVVRTLVDESQAGGSYRVTWEGKDDRGKRASSGIYFSVLDVGGKRQTRKLALLK